MNGKILKAGAGGYREFLPWIMVLVALFAIPAAIVRISMVNVPVRSEIKVITVFQDAVNVIESRFRQHAGLRKTGGRLTPLPTDSMGWILIINPMGRKAPGGGPAILTSADATTGAVGLVGDGKRVTIMVPAYRNLDERVVVLEAPDLLAATISREKH